jgi:hypothetical protein
MKFDPNWILLTIPVFVIVTASVLTYDLQQQRVTFQHTYNKNLECRQALKGEIMTRVNEICGPVPQIKDFVGGN